MLTAGAKQHREAGASPGARHSRVVSRTLDTPNGGQRHLHVTGQPIEEALRSRVSWVWEESFKGGYVGGAIGQ
jgi:hypothetical protein